MKHTLLALTAAVGLLSPLCTLADDMTAPAPYVVAALASPDRPKADTDRDALRKPAELVAFAGLKPGQRVADIMPGRGYFTRIFSKVVGPQGKVYAITPSELAAKVPEMAHGIRILSAQPGFLNVAPIVVPTAAIAAPEKLDVAWTSDNYHDVYGFFGADEAAKFDAAVFKALKPGGVFIVIDHVALAGTSAVSPTKLHRIDPATVKAQIEHAGFAFVAESPLLHNAQDDHTIVVFNPAIRGHTDQFVFKFSKP